MNNRSTRIYIAAIIALTAVLPLSPLPSAPAGADSSVDRTYVASRLFRPILIFDEIETIRVPAFRIDRAPVSIAEFRAFVSANAQWRRSRTPRIFATVLGIRYSHRADGVIAHTDRIVVLDRDGRIIASVDGIMQPVESAADAVVAAAR